MRAKALVFMLLALLLALWSVPVYAQSIPPLPHAFYGDVIINGASAPVGTTVEVRGEGVTTGIEGNPITTTDRGKYGSSNPLEPKLIVQGDILDGATFDPAITIEFIVDPATLPPGIDVEDLVIAYYDEVAGEWVGLTTTYDPATNTFTADVDHFTTFAVLARAAPAAFTATDLVITPEEVDIGETVTISVLVTNTGDLTGSYEVILKIDEVAVATKDVTLDGGASQKVTFTTTKDIAGTYAVNVNGQVGTFIVKAPPVPAAFAASALTISPTEVDIGETVTISVLVANTGDLAGSYEVTLKIDNVVVATKDITLDGGASQKVTFTTTKDFAGTYAVNVNGQVGTFVVKPPINWPLLGGIIAAVVVVGLLIFFLVRRRAA